MNFGYGLADEGHRHSRLFRFAQFRPERLGNCPVCPKLALALDRGGVLHRIWSTDWFHRPDEELRKVLAAIEAAKIEWAGRAKGTKQPTETPTIEKVEIPRHEHNGNGNGNGTKCLAQPYKVASFRIQASQEIHEVVPSELARVVARIIEIEGPVHCDEIKRRVTRLWGIQRTGRRVREAIDEALVVAAGKPGISFDGNFYSLQDGEEVPVRDRGDVEFTTLRKPEMLPPIEIRKAVSAIVKVHLGVASNEAVTETARLFGFRTTSAQLRCVIEREIETMLQNDTLQERNGKLYIPEGAAY